MHPEEEEVFRLIMMSAWSASWRDREGRADFPVRLVPQRGRGGLHRVLQEVGVRCGHAEGGRRGRRGRREGGGIPAVPTLLGLNYCCCCMHHLPPLLLRLQRSILWSLVLGMCWHMIHILVSIMHFGSYLIQLLHCFLISSGVLRKDKILPLHRLRYLAVVIDSEEAKDTLKIKKLLRWLSNIGVKHVILYDLEGILKRSEASIRKWTCSSTGHCECDIHTLSPLVDQEKMTVEVVSSYDGKEAVVKAANFLCSRYMKENNVVGDQRELVFTEADIADALTTVGCGGPEPDLLLVFSPVRCHWGFPAWRIRYTEIVHMGSLKSMKYGAITKAIYDLSRKHQNFGS